jgi:hypothetical protein
MSEYEHIRHAKDETDEAKDDVEAHKMRHRVKHATEEGGEGDDDSKEPEVEAHKMRHRVRHANEEGGNDSDSTEPDVEAHLYRM